MLNLMKLFQRSPCNGICKFGEVRDGYQYCETCGIAIVAPKPKVCEQHKFEVFEKITATSIYSGNVKSYVFISHCINCGEIKTDKITGN